MRWIFGQIGVVGVTVLAALLWYFIQSRAMHEVWIARAERLSQQHGEAFGSFLAVAWSATVIMALLVMLAVMSVASFRLCRNAMREGRSAFLRYRLRHSMEKYISRQEALEMIARSDFVKARDPRSRDSENHLTGMMATSRALFGGRSKRDEMIYRRFLRNVLQAFEARRESAVTAEGYEADVLRGWLEEIFAEEVRNEMGDIPEV